MHNRNLKERQPEVGRGKGKRSTLVKDTRDWANKRHGSLLRLLQIKIRLFYAVFNMYETCRLSIHKKKIVIGSDT